MKPRVVCAAGVCLLVHVAAPAQAQSTGRVSVGVGMTSVRPRAPELRHTTFPNLIVRLNPGAGWGLAGALDWFNADLGGSFDGVGRTEVRPIMGGVGYGFRKSRVWSSVSVVGGPAINRIRLNDSARDNYQIVKSQRITLAIRPGASVTYNVLPRVGLTAFAGYLFNRPHYTLRTGAGDIRTRWTTDSTIVSAGVVFSPF